MKATVALISSSSALIGSMSPPTASRWLDQSSRHLIRSLPAAMSRAACSAVTICNSLSFGFPERAESAKVARADTWALGLKSNHPAPEANRAHADVSFAAQEHRLPRRSTVLACNGEVNRTSCLRALEGRQQASVEVRQPDTGPSCPAKIAATPCEQPTKPGTHKLSISPGV